MKYIGFVVLIIVLFASLFKVYGAELTNNVAAVALMVLLLSLFSDLKEFNFWGLTGTRDLKENLQKLQGKPAVTDQSFPRVPKAQMQTYKISFQLFVSARHQRHGPNANDQDGDTGSRDDWGRKIRFYASYSYS